MRRLIINKALINDESDCYIIAEIGHNHQGSLEKARALFVAAKECGVNAVKLQKRNNRLLYTDSMYNMPYDNENSFGATYGAHREALELSKSDYWELKKLAEELNLDMFATAWDYESADFLAEINVPAFKIASGDLTSIPLLEYIAKFRKPMIISTGGGTLEDVLRAYDAIYPNNDQICIMQCTANYPVDPEDMNLNVITTFREKFPNIVIGLSDHQSGIAMSTVAYVLGARVFEKHFTLNRAWMGTDHKFSLEPIGMKKLVRDLRRVRLALGDGIKRRLSCEEKPLLKMAKKIVAAQDLKEGQVLTVKDVSIKSPGNGLPPYHLNKIIGRRLSCSLKKDENLTFDILQSS